MRETYKFNAVLFIRTQTADRNSHSIFQITIQTGLGPVVLFKVVQKLLGGAGKL